MGTRARRRCRLPSSWRATRRLGAALIAGAVAWVGLAVEAARAGDLVVVVNERNAVTEMSIQRLRLIYGGYKRTWSEGASITLLLPASGSDAMQQVAAKVMKKPGEAQVSQYYVDLVYQQKLSKEPPKLPTADCLATVRADLGAIALLDRDEVQGAAGVHVLPIEGL